jgi:hypothetical protein
MGTVYDGGKKVSGRKRHLLVDPFGLLLTVAVTKANVSDQAGLETAPGRYLRRTAAARAPARSTPLC